MEQLAGFSAALSVNADCVGRERERGSGLWTALDNNEVVELAVRNKEYIILSRPFLGNSIKPFSGVC